MTKEEAIEILSDMRAEYNIFSDNEEEATRYHALSWAIQALNERTGRWIPVSEGLPEIDMSYPHHKNYFVQYDSGGMDVASWSNVNRFWTNHVTEPYWNCAQFEKVIAWMPLPSSYKEEQE